MFISPLLIRKRALLALDPRGTPPKGPVAPQSPLTARIRTLARRGTSHHLSQIDHLGGKRVRVNEDGWNLTDEEGVHANGDVREHLRNAHVSRDEDGPHGR